MRRSFHSRLSSRRYGRLEEPDPRSHYPNFVGSHLGSLHKLLDVVPPERTIFAPHPVLCCGSERPKGLWGNFDSLPSPTFCPLHIRLGRIPNPLKFRDAPLEVRIRQIGQARLDGLVETRQLLFCVQGVPLERDDPSRLAFRRLIPAFQKRAERLFEEMRAEEPINDAVDDQVVQLVHRDGSALAALRALPRSRAAGVVAVFSSLSGRSKRHSATAIGAERHAAEQGRAAYETGRPELRAARAHDRLDLFELFYGNDRLDLDLDDFVRRLLYALPPARHVEAVLPDVGLAGTTTGTPPA
nr:hypothetical protein [Brucella endophytica]